MEPLYLFFHIPKTGGQTLRDHLLSELVNGHDYLHLGRLGPTDPCPRTMDDVVAMSDEQRRRVRVISGHDVSRDLSRVFARRPIREVTFLREPAQRIISHYNFAMTMRCRLGRPVQAFEEFVERRIGNDPMTRFLAERLLSDRSRDPLNDVLFELSNFWLVARTERLDEFLPLLFEDIGLAAVVPQRSNVTGVTIDRHIDPDPDVLDELRERNPLDVMLYETTVRFEDSYLGHRRSTSSDTSSNQPTRRKWCST